MALLKAYGQPLFEGANTSLSAMLAHLGPLNMCHLSTSFQVGVAFILDECDAPPGREPRLPCYEERCSSIISFSSRESAIMKFGLHLDNAQYPHPEQVVNSWQELVSIADVHGFDYVSVVDHLVPFPDFRAKDLPLFDPWQMLAAFACQTRHVTLLTLVSNASVQQPAVLAKRAATLDVISQERMMLGLGAGGYTADEAAIGVVRASQRERYARLEECVVTLQKLWTGNPVTHQGQFTNLVDYTSAPTPKHTPRILIAGKSRAILTLAATLGSASNFAFTDHAKTETLVHRLTEALSSAGRSLEEFEITLLDRLFVAESDAQAAHAWKNSGAPTVNGHPGLIGGPETLTLKLKQLMDVGVNTLFGMFSDASSLKYFCTEVIPRIRQQ